MIEALAALGGLALGRSALEHALASRRGLDPGALQRRFLEARSAAPAASLPESLRFLPAEWPLVGRSEALGVAREALERFAATSAGLLISGPPGVGKGTLARHAAAQLQPQGAPPVVVDLRLVDPLGRALLGPELDPTRPCAARRARGGVLILERLDAAAPALQAKLLDALAERALPDGTPLEARVVATAHAPELAVASGALRADLLALAGTIRAHLPPLDARPEDVAPLAQAILAAWGEAAPTLGEGALEALAARGWPGNARELYGVLRTLALRAGTPPLAAEDVPPLGRESLTAALEAQARLLIHGALARAGGDLEAARARLGLTAEELAAWVGAPRGPGSEDAPEG
ncbi:MAG: sigma 54-interacting transcriptional regulator [Planctomycetota bacterium]